MPLRRSKSWALFLILSTVALALAACQQQAPAPTPEGEPAVVGSSQPAPSEGEPSAVDPTPGPGNPSPSGEPAPNQPRLVIHEFPVEPLSALVSEAVEYLEGRAGTNGVAVVLPERGIAYQYNGDGAFHMASVAKVVIMLTKLDQTLQEERMPTEAEMALLEPMITVSDNDAATALWYQVGGSEGVANYLESIHITGIEPNSDDCWGASFATPRALALLLAKLAMGEILDGPHRAVALDLMARVIQSQAWGSTDVVPESPPPGTIAGIKDGWYPAPCGWWVNSVGYILPGNEQAAYTIAVMTNEQPTYEYGRETIATAARLIHNAVHGGP